MSTTLSRKILKSSSEGELLEKPDTMSLLNTPEDKSGTDLRFHLPVSTDSRKSHDLRTATLNSVNTVRDCGRDDTYRKSLTLSKHSFMFSRFTSGRRKKIIMTNLVKDQEAISDKVPELSTQMYERLRGGSTSPSDENMKPFLLGEVSITTSETKQPVKLQRKNSLKKFFNRMMKQISTVPSTNDRHRPMMRSQTEFSVSTADVRSFEPNTPNNQSFDSDSVPGVIGLRNQGNTCFMNAVLQCLSHTDILAKYFVLDMYKQDLIRRNKWNSKKYGTKGELTEHLALLLKSVWSCQYDPEISSQFKSVIDKYGTQYRGSNQHDAQEFLMWLLDKVHEDLNTAGKRKYKTIKNSYGKPDELVAEETLANHLRCDSSFVQDLFQAQFRSSLTCLNCHRQSNTFDPFLCVSIPIPQQQLCQVYVTIIYLSQQPREVKLGLNLSVQADVKELREVLTSDTGLEEGQLLLTEIDGEGFHRTFSENQPINVLQKNEALYCIEMPKHKASSEEDGAFLLLCWINVLVQEDITIRFGGPYTMQINRETSYEDLQKLILKEMNTIVHDDIMTTKQEVPLFRIRIFDGLNTPTYLDSGLDHPLYMVDVEQALNLCDVGSGPQHLKFVLEWDSQNKERIIFDDTEKVEEHSSVRELKSNPPESTAVTLRECFELYTRAETLGADDAWLCPFCNRKQEVVKKLGLWSLPDILVIHLKRFRQSSKQRSTTKLTTTVDFPLVGFDMSPHLSHRNSATNNNAMSANNWSPWKRQKNQNNNMNNRIGDEVTYDLYALCNHQGKDLQGGHYTAYCKNPYDDNWYCFDDTKVTDLNETDVKTSSAYILFYQRSCLTTAINTNRHWVSRMPTFTYVPKPSRSQENILSPKSHQESRRFPRGERAYATLQPSKKKINYTTDNELDRHSDTEAPVVQSETKAKPIVEPEITTAGTETATDSDITTATSILPILDPPSPHIVTKRPTISTTTIAESSV